MTGAGDPGETDQQPPVFWPFTLLVLLNLANYIDRQTLSAVLPLVNQELRLSDTQGGQLGSLFLVSYMLAGLLLGNRLDAWPPWKTLGWTCIGWSAVAGLGAFAPDFRFLATTRLLLGVAEAVYVSVAPVLVAVLFPEYRRTRMLSIFSLAIPVGSALGFAFGGLLGDTIGWRHSLMITGFGSVPLGVWALGMKEPERLKPASDRPPSLVKSIGLLVRDSRYRLIALGGAGATFALGALALWLPTDLVRRFDFSLGKAGVVSGGVIAGMALVGTLSGGLLAEKHEQHKPWMIYWIPAAGMALGAILSFPYFLLESAVPAIFSLAVAVLFVFFHTGPTQRALLDRSPKGLAALGFAFNVFFIHAAGDVWSQPLAGWLSDAGTDRGLPPATALRDALMLVGIPSMLAGALFFGWAGLIERRAHSSGQTGHDLPPGSLSKP